jgi:hypothetical protein
VREAVLFVRHDDLCNAPHDTIDRMPARAKRDASSFRKVCARYASVLAEPRYARAGRSRAAGADHQGCVGAAGICVIGCYLAG